ncbi:hypothetical protein, partial [Streptomyces afghaniensis]|uniref:hypothetical protein n=1 Tax=Streptomyces afghaniensis TaxID=66865 RepID=UPI0012B6AA62
MQSKVNRRVSFAPDVTLHSFDFAPSNKEENNIPIEKDIITSTQTHNDQKETTKVDIEENIDTS